MTATGRITLDLDKILVKFQSVKPTFLDTPYLINYSIIFQY
jgi:hypothetical protein